MDKKLLIMDDSYYNYFDTDEYAEKKWEEAYFTLSLGDCVPINRKEIEKILKYKGTKEYSERVTKLLEEIPTLNFDC